MASAHCLTSGGIIGIAQAQGRDKAIVTVEGDGTTIYDLKTKVSTRSWALGKGDVEFAAPAVFHRGSQYYFAAVHGAASSSEPTLLSWSKSAEAGTIQNIGNHIQLSAPVAAVLPISTAGPKSSKNDDLAAMDIDGSAAPSTAPAVFVAHSNGSVSLCSTTEVLSESSESSGCPLLAAAADVGILHTVHSIRGKTSASKSTSGALLGRFRIAGGKMQCEALRSVVPPVEGCVPVAGAFSNLKAVILWSDGSVASYNTNAAVAAETLEPSYVRKLKGFVGLGGDAAAERMNSKTPARRKRGLNTDSNGVSEARFWSSAAVTVVNTEEGVIAVVGWAAESPSSLRVVTIDAIYGAVQSSNNLSAGDVGATKLDSQKPLQAVGLGSPGARQIALAAGGSALVVEFDVKQPTLANMIGALSVPFQAQHAQQDAAAPAIAASSALDENDLAALVAPRGGAAGPLKYRIHSKQGDAELLGAAEVDWAVQGAAGIREAESTAWTQLLDAGSEKKGLTESAFLNIAKPLLQKAQKSRTGLSYDLLCKLLLVAAENGHWNALETILSAQQPISLAGCGGLVSSLVLAFRFDLLHVLLQGATDVAAADILAVLKGLLGSKKTGKALEKYAEKIRGIADDAVTAAEKAAQRGASNSGTLIATAACAAGTVEKFSSAQLALHPLLVARHDGAILLTALRGLPAVHAVALLKYILKWLRNYRTTINDCHVMAPDVPELAVPAPEAILQWAAAAVDAGASRLMLRQDAAGVIKALQAELQPQVAALRRLAQVKGAVEHLQCGAPLPTPMSGTTAGRYTLEWLSLKVT